MADNQFFGGQEEQYISADLFLNMKNIVKKQVLMRKYNRNISAFGNSNYDFSKIPQKDTLISAEHIAKIINPMQQINEQENFDLNNPDQRYYDYIINALNPVDQNKINFTENLTKYNKVTTRDYNRGLTHYCDAQCTGMCNTQCSEGCYTSCKGSCSGSCKGSCDGCSGGCSGSCGSACSTSDGSGGGNSCTCGGSCSTQCTTSGTTGGGSTCKSCGDACQMDCGGGRCSGVCYNTCSNNCTGGCKSTCTGQCNSCGGSCNNSCSATCSGGCSGTAQWEIHAIH